MSFVEPVMSVVVRSANPLRTARLVTSIMARQNTVNFMLMLVPNVPVNSINK